MRDGLGPLPDSVTVHLDRGYDSEVIRERLTAPRLHAEIAEKRKPVPVTARQRWVVEWTNAWINTCKKLVWWTERRGRVIDFWIIFAIVIVVVGRLVRQARTRYRWDDRPHPRP